MPVVPVDTSHDAAVAIAGGRGPVVTIPVYEAYDDAVPCLEAVVAHTAPDVSLLVVDDGSTDVRLRGLPDVFAAVPHLLVVLRREQNRGFVYTMNEAFTICGRRDVVLLNSDVVVGPQWLERLREAAYSDTRIASATPLTNHGTIVSVPHRNTPSELPAALTPHTAAAAVAAASLRLRPRLPTCVGHCTYVRRMALDLVGGFDEAFAPGYGEEVDWSQRCILAGLAHVCADDVFVYHRGAASFGPRDGARALRDDHERRLTERYPYYHPWVGATRALNGTPLACAIGVARRALTGLTVAFDATSLGTNLAGTQRLAVEVARALAEHPAVGTLLVVTRPGASPDYLLRALSERPTARILADDPALRLDADVAYRPLQVWSAAEVERLRRLGDRVVVQQLDLIAFNNPSYFPSRRDWAQCRDAARFALAVADGVAFSTPHAETDACAEGLLPSGTPTCVTWNGIDHSSRDLPPVKPVAVPEGLVGRGFVLCFGTDYRHKNRMFALRTFEAMATKGWPGGLVLAGPRMAHGSSRHEEAEFLRSRPLLAQRVVTLSEVGEAERVWLFRHAGLVLCPTLYEGFGLVPFEAALEGTPCLSARVTALDQVLPPGIEVIEAWEPERVAEQILGQLGDAARRRRVVEAIACRAREFTWARTAGQLVELFEEVCRARPRPQVAAIRGDGGVMPRLEPGGVLESLERMYPREVHELLRAIGQRHRLRRPISALAVFAYRVASKLRTRVRGSPPDPTS
jgi:GT2 family glycosyltransferase/glycosyltransferase involved in cell wall biosynthesis